MDKLFACCANGERAEFRAGLHDAKDGIARDHADDLGGAVVGAGDNGYLVDIGGEQAFEEAEEGFVWRGP